MGSSVAHDALEGPWAVVAKRLLKAALAQRRSRRSAAVRADADR